MIQRCYNPNRNNYHNYGARGIAVCPEWRESFLTFLEDMGPRPEGHSLDRIDTDGDYRASNCMWSTRAKQNRNRRNNKLTAEDVAAIRSSGDPTKVAAKRFGVSKTMILNIRNNVVWK